MPESSARALFTHATAAPVASWQFRWLHSVASGGDAAAASVLVQQ
jgi:hypothetical protein